MSQKIIRGSQALPLLLEMHHKILLVHGKSFEEYPIRSLFQTVRCVDFMDFTPNPIYEDVCRGVELFNKEQCDAIVAVGGGSAIDVAKCIKLFCKMDKNVNYLEQERKETGVPLLAIPTTAGTGSESTKHAVIYYKEAKQSIFHTSIIPNYAVLIGSLLKGLPVYQKKCTMLDALCQAIESWWSINSTEESKEYSKKAIVGIKNNWDAYITNNDNKAAEKIIVAANFAGRAINITATTAAHAMSYQITTLYKIPHGHAVAVCLPEVWEYALEHTIDCNDSRGKEYLESALDDISNIVNLEWYKELLYKLEIEFPTAINKVEDLEILINSVNPVRLKNYPIELTTEALKGMYERIIR